MRAPPLLQPTLPIVAPRLMALVALHGLVDAAHPWSLVAYAPLLLPAAAHAWVDALGFFIASVLHFADDCGMGESALLHAVLVGLHGSGRTRAAVQLVLAHFALVHLPRLWMRALGAEQEEEEARPAETLVLMAGAAAGIAAPRRICTTLLGASKHDTFVLSWWLQRAIVCHVCASLLQKTTFTLCYLNHHHHQFF